MPITQRIIASDTPPDQTKGAGGKVIRFLTTKGVKDIVFIGRNNKGDQRYKGLRWNLNSTSATSKTKKVLTEMYGPGFEAWPDWFFWKHDDTLLSLNISKGGGATYSVLTVNTGKANKWIDRMMERVQRKTGFH